MFAVIFEVNPHPHAWDEYLALAATLRPDLLAIDGFIANDRYASLHRTGWLVSLSFWHDEKALIRWRTHALHNNIQRQGRTAVFADYHLRVGEVAADTSLQTPPPRQRFDTTNIGNTTVTLTERPLDSPAATRPPNGDTFDSIARPGHGLYLREWPDIPAATAAIADAPGRHRIVQIIRDYGMFARTEAPQYFPP